MLNLELFSINYLVTIIYNKSVQFSLENNKQCLDNLLGDASCVGLSLSQYSQDHFHSVQWEVLMVGSSNFIGAVQTHFFY